MDRIHIEKGSVQETLIIPLYGRKLCAEHFPTLYQDKYAARICESIDYDFSQFKGKENSAMYQFGALEGAMREKDMLWEITDYLKGHPNAAVVNLGCGLNMTGRTADNGTFKTGGSSHRKKVWQKKAQAVMAKVLKRYRDTVKSGFLGGTYGTEEIGI